MAETAGGTAARRAGGAGGEREGIRGDQFLEAELGGGGGVALAGFGERRGGEGDS